MVSYITAGTRCWKSLLSIAKRQVNDAKAKSKPRLASLLSADPVGSCIAKTKLSLFRNSPAIAPARSGEVLW
ncbi:hypothetical protein TRIATDRAFT_257013 [Trichoderma atroviride IMI 206040]|uniref:Uncharacterized protein n=1 Tax=Hypocrea atroviridis (strain ATCC 20476 / IMI 206040) TaxID=452589 RepID=G9NV19_HYPAI|nr:uncharacterized protein TRIATDRAFT_257013 [Trichoderma atroviride IMI 206040]EHK44844.1 hypothetical protein TRIATDRAFT_257013 [Trichoderma atroviride IMI 206040]